MSDVYQGLPADERARTIVVGANYGHSGALEYWSKDYDLPSVFGVHNNYWLWGPPPADEDTVMIVIDSSAGSLEEMFDEVTVAGVAESPWAMESYLEIHVCRGLKRPIGEIWSEIKLFV